MTNFILNLKNKHTVLIFFICWLVSPYIYAQKYELPKDTTAIKKADKVPEKDIIDISKNVIRFFTPTKFKHPLVATDSTKKDSDKVFYAFLPSVGYALQTGPTVGFNFLLNFFTGKKNKDSRLSAVTICPVFSFEHQVIIPVQSNVWLFKNKINLLGDWRYYLYPTYTYGLGGETVLANNNTVRYSFVRVYEQASKRLFPNFYVGVGYGLDWHFDIKQEQTEGLGTDFSTYSKSKRTRTVSSGPVLNITYDSRDNINNSRTGNYANIVFHSNLTLFGSNKNWQSLQLDLRKFIKLHPNGKHILALWSYNWFTFGGKAPYFDLPSTGWDTYSNTGRGYIQGRLRGSSMIYLETEYRYPITKNGLLGGVVFANAESVADYNPATINQKNLFDSKFTTILPAAGLGLRLKINKTSRVNFALDYGWGVGGSHCFIFNLSEIF